MLVNPILIETKKEEKITVLFGAFPSIQMFFVNPDESFTIIS